MIQLTRTKEGEVRYIFVNPKKPRHPLRNFIKMTRLIYDGPAVLQAPGIRRMLGRTRRGGTLSLHRSEAEFFSKEAGARLQESLLDEASTFDDKAARDRGGCLEFLDSTIEDSNELLRVALSKSYNWSLQYVTKQDKAAYNRLFSRVRREFEGLGLERRQAPVFTRAQLHDPKRSHGGGFAEVVCRGSHHWPRAS